MTSGASAPRRPLLVLLPAMLAPAAALAAVALAGPWPSLGRAALPALATAAVYPVFAFFVARGARRSAVLSALLWAASLSAAIIVLAARDPEGTGRAVLMGPSYRDEMFQYVASGAGRETDPGRFVPQHLLHAGLFSVVTLLSGGLLGLAMGSALVGYMSFYVGALAGGPHPATAALLGWPPWAIVRVVAFVLLGAVLARPLLVRLRGAPAAPLFEPDDRRLFLAAVLLLIADIVLKTTLAPTWSTLLRPCLPT